MQNADVTSTPSRDEWSPEISHRMSRVSTYPSRQQLSMAMKTKDGMETKLQILRHTGAACIQFNFSSGREKSGVETKLFGWTQLGCGWWSLLGLGSPKPRQAVRMREEVVQSARRKFFGL